MLVLDPAAHVETAVPLYALVVLSLQYNAGKKRDLVSSYALGAHKKEKVICVQVHLSATTRGGDQASSLTSPTPGLPKLQVTQAPHCLGHGMDTWPTSSAGDQTSLLGVAHGQA